MKNHKTFILVLIIMVSLVFPDLGSKVQAQSRAKSVVQKRQMTAVSDKAEKLPDLIVSDIKLIKDCKIHVSGHTDNVPIAPHNRYKYPSNWELSAARAAAVVRFLIDQSDLAPENLEAVGHSFFKPIAANDTPENRAQNRRVEIVIVP